MIGKKPTFLRMFDEQTGHNYLCPVTIVNHETKRRRDKPFKAHCGFCSNESVELREEYIQWGWLTDRHWLTVFCGACNCATIHKYEVHEDGN